MSTLTRVQATRTKACFVRKDRHWLDVCRQDTRLRDRPSRARALRAYSLRAIDVDGRLLPTTSRLATCCPTRPHTVCIMTYSTCPSFDHWQVSRATCLCFNGRRHLPSLRPYAARAVPPRPPPPCAACAAPCVRVCGRSQGAMPAGGGATIGRCVLMSPHPNADARLRPRSRGPTRWQRGRRVGWLGAGRVERG